MTFTQVKRWLFPRLGDMHATRLNTLSALVFGFLSSARLGIAAIASGVMGDTTQRHKRKRVDRFLADFSFETGFSTGDAARRSRCASPRTRRTPDRKAHRGHSNAHGDHGPVPGEQKVGMTQGGKRLDNVSARGLRCCGVTAEGS